MLAMNVQRMITRIARGGANQRGRARRGTRPQGEGRGFTATVSRLLRRR